MPIICLSDLHSNNEMLKLYKILWQGSPIWVPIAVFHLGKGLQFKKDNNFALVVANFSSGFEDMATYVSLVALHHSLVVFEEFLVQYPRCC